ncbi:MAG: cytochrome c biogenesis protein CcsA [Bacteroidia bacterium]|nr:cytochrome c biogenesis protein CcsA [Bacteroidia bacterium]
MKKISDLLFSSKTTLVLLLIFAFSIACATFIEEKYDVITARSLVYNSKWLELVILLLAINFAGNIGKYSMATRGKIAQLIFHLAFIILIIGAGVTRYFGSEGIMHIREGKSSDFIYSSLPYLQVSASDDKQTYELSRQMNISQYLNNSFVTELKTQNGPIKIQYDDFIKNAEEKVVGNSQGGTDIVELTLASHQDRQSFRLMNGEIKTIGKVTFSLNNNKVKNAVRIYTKDNELYMISPDTIRTISHGMKADSIQEVGKDTIARLEERRIYSTLGNVFILNHYYKNAVIEYVKGSSDHKGDDILVLNVSFNGTEKHVSVICEDEESPEPSEININGMKIDVSYGPEKVQLPFSILLNKFILERYPGSMSPSSYASEVTLIDGKRNLQKNARIFMNNVLDYRGYRFFQSSYDTDEKGTILSVNHDFWGTWISYLGYLLLALGFILSMLSKNSRFKQLSRKIKDVRIKKKKLLAAGIFIFVILSGGYSQNPETKMQRPVSRDQANKFGHLVVQTFDGRFEPVHTLAVDMLHKISRMDDFHATGKGDLNALQVIMDILLDPDYWKQQKIIYVSDKAVRDVIGIKGKYASFNDFLDDRKNYKLSDYAEKAFRKKQSEQNTFDKEIIKTDERINVFMSALNGEMLRIFPSPVPNDNKWISVNDSLAYLPLNGKLKTLTADLKLDELNLGIVLRYYFFCVFQATETGDYSSADKILGRIDSIQREGSQANILPSRKKVDYEILYNKLQIFDKLRDWYGILSLILLTLAFIENFRSDNRKLIKYLQGFFISLLSIAFVFHTFGLILRWYLSGHAPWSNGYEALIFVGWAGLLAGFSFIRYSKITLGATALLAFIVLMTAGHSSYDPQLTNLQPVLKSYWLIIHVAVITISYGFLALGFILGIINMLLYLFRNTKNFTRLDLVTSELTYTNEMALIAGISLATVGTFLGGVWANESWGKYWGWDAKETWALIIIMTYAVILHFRMVPALKSRFIFNAASILGFGSVMMTFAGVNYYFTKGMHSYAAGEKTVFPLWAWILILSVILLIIFAKMKYSSVEKNLPSVSEENNAIHEPDSELTEKPAEDVIQEFSS